MRVAGPDHVAGVRHVQLHDSALHHGRGVGCRPSPDDAREVLFDMPAHGAIVLA